MILMKGLYGIMELWNYDVLIAKEYGNILKKRSLTHVALNVMK
jgi:hypothetical protein